MPQKFGPLTPPRQRDAHGYNDPRTLNDFLKFVCSRYSE